MSSGVIGGASGGSFDALGPRARRLAFATVMLAFVLDITDSTIVNTALPAIQASLHAGTAAMQWIVAGYFLSFAVLLVAGGRLGDLYGYRRMFLFGVGGFTAASLACGAAGSGEALASFRVAQGAAAAIMAPQVMALVQHLFTPVERVRKLAAFGLVGGLAAIGGPILGGLLIQADIAGLGWRVIFLVNGPIGLLALAAGWRLLPDGRSSHPLEPDPLGVFLLAAALGALLLPLIGGRERGWPWPSLAALAASPALLRLFWRHSIVRAARRGSALIAPDLFRERLFSTGLAMTLLFGTATTGFLFVLSITLQRGLGYSPLGTALAHVPFGAGVMLGVGLIGPRALPRFGKWVLVAGAAAMAVGCAAAGGAIASRSTWLLLFSLALAGLGMGAITGPLSPVTLARVDRGHAGVAGGTHGAVQQIGGALGSATIGTLFFAAVDGAAYAQGFAAALWAIGLLLLGVAVLALRLPEPIFPDARTNDHDRG